MIIKKKGSRFFLVYLILPALLFSSPGLVPGAAAKTINFSASSDTASFLGGLNAADWLTSEKPVVGDMMGTNLIPNAQMESDSYWTDAPDQALIAGPFGNDIYAHESTESGTACYLWASTARIPVDQNKTYKFSIWVKALTADESNFFGYHTYNAAGAQLSSNPYFRSGSTANEWTLYEGILGPSYSTNCNTSLTNGTDYCMESGTAYVIMRFGSCYGNGNNTGKTYYAYPVIQEVNPESLGTSGNYYVGGNVGIGKVTPAAKLDLSGTFRSSALAGSGNVTVMADNAGTLYTANTWLQNGTSVYKSSGNVGIGTNSPVKKLEVTGSTPSLYVWANDSGTSDFFVGENSSGGYGLNINWDSSYTYTMNARYAGTNTSIYQVDTRNNYSVFNTNVGIGSATPGQKLDVNGYTKATGFCIGTSCITSWPTAGADTVIGNEVTNATNATLARSGSGTAAAPYTLALNLGNANTWTAAQTFSGGASFPSGIWNTSGYVGIGTTGPAERVNIVGGHGDTRLRLSAFTGVASPSDSAFLSLWASEPGLTYTGAGIGNNINGNSHYGRIATTRGASYIRLLDSGLAFNTISSDGTDTNVMYINGVNVGVGSTGPSAKLYVNGSFRSSSALVSGLAGAGTVLVMSDNSGNLYSGASGTSGQTLRHNGTSWVSNSALYNNGTNVGVGPTSPGQKLDVGTATSHYIRSYGGFVGNAAANIGGTGAAAYFPSGAYIAGSSSWIYGGVSFNGILKDNQATPRWQINPAGNSWFYGGNLGIGTTVTYAKLEVNGATAFDASNPSTATYGLHFTGPATVGYGSGITWGGYNSTEAQAGIYVKSDSNSTSMYFGTTESYDYGAQTRMIIDSGGNVGIGTTGPGKLFVGGALYSGSASIYGLAGSGNTMVMADNNGSLYAATPAAVNGWTVNGGNVFASGNVGIATTTALARLEVNGNALSHGLIIYDNYKPQLKIQNSASNYSGNIKVEGNKMLFFGSGDSNVYGLNYTKYGSYFPIELTLNSSYEDLVLGSSEVSIPEGSLTIGTASVNRSLSVYGTGSFTGAVSVGTPTLAAHAVPKSYVDARVLGSGTTNYTLRYDGSTWSSSSVLINNGTNVGVGTASPGEKLHVYGDLKISSDSDVSTSVGSGALYILNTGGNTGLHLDNNEIQMINTDLYIQNDNLTPTHINNLMHLTTAGNVGVGTNAPGQKLHVVGNSYATGNGMFAGLAFHGGSSITTDGIDRLNLVAGNYTYIPYGAFYVGGRSHFRGGIDNDQDTYLTVAGGTSGVTYFSGAVGIGNAAPSYTLDVSGSMRATGDIYANAFLYNSSDRRLKENIKPLTRSLSKIQALEGVSFDWKKTGRSSLGLIAQDVELIYPELVSVDKEGYKAIAYEGLIAPLIEAVKAQQLEIENLEARLEKLEARVGQ